MKSQCKDCARESASGIVVPRSKEFKDSGETGTPDTGWRKIDEDERWAIIAKDLAHDD